MNRPIVGFFIGLLMPVIGFLVVFLILGRGMTFGSFWNVMLTNHKQLALVLSLSILANLVPFIIFNNKRWDYAARGIFIATMLYAITIILLKFVWN